MAYDDNDVDIRRSSAGGPDDNLTGADIALGIICSGIGCIMGLVYLIQGKPKAGKMIGLSLAFAVLWNIVSFAIQAALKR